MTEISSLLETSPGLERDELTRLRTFVNLPRPAFMELPEAVALVRLRAIEEIGKLLSKTGGKALQEWRAQWTKSPTDGSAEELWALYYSNAG